MIESFLCYRFTAIKCLYYNFSIIKTYTEDLLKCVQLFQLFFYRGLRKLALKNVQFGLSEFYHGLNKRAQVKRLQRYVPSIRHEDIVR